MAWGPAAACGPGSGPVFRRWPAQQRSPAVSPSSCVPACPLPSSSRAPLPCTLGETQQPQQYT